MRKLPSTKTVSEIAALVGGQAIGDGQYTVDAVAEVTNAGPKDIASFHNMKYLEAASKAPAGCLLVPPPAKDSPCAATTKIVVSDPQAAFAILLGIINKSRLAIKSGISPRSSVHPKAIIGANVSIGDFAVVEEGAQIGESSVISAQCYIGANASVGKNSYLYPQVVIREECVVGDKVVIHSGTIIGADGFGFTTDLKTGRHTKIPQIGNVVIKDNVEIGANVTIDRATLGSTLIESGVQIDNLVQIAHNVKIGQDSVIVSQVGIAGSTVVGRNVVLAGQVGIAGHLNIGDGSVLAAQTGVMSDVPPKTTLFGSPGRPHREAFKLQALYGRLPEIVDRLKALEENK